MLFVEIRSHSEIPQVRLLLLFFGLELHIIDPGWAEIDRNGADFLPQVDVYYERVVVLATRLSVDLTRFSFYVLQLETRQPTTMRGVHSQCDELFIQVLYSEGGEFAPITRALVDEEVSSARYEESTQVKLMLLMFYLLCFLWLDEFGRQDRQGIAYTFVDILLFGEEVVCRFA